MAADHGTLMQLRKLIKRHNVGNKPKNSPFHIKQKYAWNAHAFQLGYIFARGNAPFPYISMGQAQ